MQTLAVLAAAVVLSLVGPSRPADAKCRMMGLAPEVIAVPQTPLDGGIVVGFTDAEDIRPEAGDIAVQPSWRFVIDGKSVTPTIVTLAPGLALYKFPAGASGDISLVDGKRLVAKARTTTQALRKLPAPKAKAIRLEQRLGRRPFANVTVELDGDAPVQAIALVLADAKGTPLSWGRVTERGKVEVLRSRRCHVLPNGTQTPTPNQKVTLFWVDAAGTRSPASAPIAIRASATEDAE